jgi:hypothetical protein
MCYKILVINEWVGLVSMPTGGPMIISSSLTGWPIGFLTSAGNPTPLIILSPAGQ